MQVESEGNCPSDCLMGSTERCLQRTLVDRVVFAQQLLGGVLSGRYCHECWYPQYSFVAKSRGLARASGRRLDQLPFQETWFNLSSGSCVEVWCTAPVHGVLTWLILPIVWVVSCLGRLPYSVQIAVNAVSRGPEHGLVEELFGPRTAFETWPSVGQSGAIDSLSFFHRNGCSSIT